MDERRFKWLLVLLAIGSLGHAAISAPVGDTSPDDVLALPATAVPPDEYQEDRPANSSASESTSKPPSNATQTVPDSGNPKVNLIWPEVERIDKIECQPLEKPAFCNITFATRAATYMLKNWELANKQVQTGSIERLSQHTLPSLKTDKVFRQDNPVDYNTLRSQAASWLNGWSKELSEKSKTKPGYWLWSSEEFPKFVICNAYASFAEGSNTFDVCFHNSQIHVRNKSDNAVIINHPMVSLMEFGTPPNLMSAARFYQVPNDTFGHHLFFVDSVGRIVVNTLTRRGNEMIMRTSNDGSMGDFFETVYAQLSIFSNPEVKPTNGQQFLKEKPWPKEANYIDTEKVHLKTYFDTDIDYKFKTAFVRAISPIYLSFGLNGTKLPHGNITKETAAFNNQTNKGDHSWALCLAQDSQMQCSFKNMDQLNYVDNANGASFEQSSRQYVPHAYHVANVAGYRYIHLFYSRGNLGPLRNQVGDNRYIFCKKKGEYAPGVTTNVKELILEAESSILIPEYSPDIMCHMFVHGRRDGKNNLPAPEIHVAPDDIVAYADGKVVKTIAFWGTLYTVTNYDMPINTRGPSVTNGTAPTPKVLDGLMFRINAAFSTGTTFYFFTHNDLLLIAPASMDHSYETLTIDWSKMTQEHSEPFLYHHMHLGAYNGDADNGVDVPFLIGFREYVKGSNTTMPPTTYRYPRDLSTPDKGNGTNEDPISPDPPSKKGGSSSTWLIILILVITALILAALGYLFFIRGSNGDEPMVEKPRSAKKSARKSPIDPDMMVKTVRSKHVSTIGTSKSTIPPAKSPSSMLAAKSPSQKSAIAKSPASGHKAPLGSPKSSHKSSSNKAHHSPSQLSAKQHSGSKHSSSASSSPLKQTAPPSKMGSKTPHSPKSSHSSKSKTHKSRNKSNNNNSKRPTSPSRLSKKSISPKSPLGAAKSIVKKR